MRVNNHGPFYAISKIALLVGRIVIPGSSPHFNIDDHATKLANSGADMSVLAELACRLV